MNSVEIQDIANKERIAIVSVGYNRLKSQKRLLKSLLEADYSKYDNVPLVISIDCSGDYALYEFVENFEWPYGDKYVYIREKRMGLKEHILSCGDLSLFFKGIILLEDDIYVSKDFYNYTNSAVNYYYDDDRVASISLYCNEMNGFSWLPMTPIHGASDVFAMPCVSTWGECWTDKMWTLFKKWYTSNEINWDSINMPSQIKKWTRAWSKYFDAYMEVEEKYSIFPYTSLTTNFSDAGEHGIDNNTIVQVGLQFGNKEYRFEKFEKLIRYTNSGLSLLPEVLGVDPNSFYTNILGTKSGFRNKRYCLSLARLPFKVVKSFGLYLRPLELNIIDNIEGSDIFLYDTTIKENKPRGNGINNLILYHLHGFNYWYLIKGLLLRSALLVKKMYGKIKKKLFKK